MSTVVPDLAKPLTNTCFAATDAVDLAAKSLRSTSKPVSRTALLLRANRCRTFDGKLYIEPADRTPDDKVENTDECTED